MCQNFMTNCLVYNKEKYLIVVQVKFWCLCIHYTHPTANLPAHSPLHTDPSPTHTHSLSPCHGDRMTDTRFLKTLPFLVVMIHITRILFTLRKQITIGLKLLVLLLISVICILYIFYSQWQVPHILYIYEINQFQHDIYHNAKTNDYR